MKSTIPLLVAALIAALPVASIAQSQPGQARGASLPRTTEVMVILTPKQGVTLDKIMAIMPAEIRETVKLYLDGKIRQWFSRADGPGVVFLLDAKTQDEARAVMETLPLARAQLVDHQYIPLGPLMPLTGLIGAAAPQ